MPDSADYRPRLALSQRLMSLPTVQLDQVIFTLRPAAGNIPPNTAKPGDRVAALLEWADSFIGPGLPALEAALDQVVSTSTGAEGLSSAEIASRRDVHIGESLDHSSVVSGDGNRVEIHHHYGLPDQKPDATRQDRNEKTLIEAVWTEVEDRLRQSLHNAILIRLDMAEQRNQVSRPWDSQLRTAEQGIKNLEPGTHIAEVFDRRDVGGKLLILGNPGAGKTTTLLDLAAVLIQRANQEPDEPIPVMFNLSSWQNEKQSISDWLLSELKLKYGVSQKLGKTWLSEKVLLPLLDGLDELPPQRQEPVVEAINGWLRSGEGPSRLLVCSRIEEYELYAAKLELNGAICLEPLTDQQLQDYLGSMGMAVLWKSLQQDAALLALVRTPLLLSVSILANEAIDAAQWRQQQTTQERMDYLLDAYVERCLHGKVKSRDYPDEKQPTAQQTRRWLIWLAKQLQAQSEDEFLIEKMQPWMLANRRQQWLYGLIVGLIGGLIGGLKTDISIRVEPNQGIRSSLKNTGILLAISILLMLGIQTALPIILANMLEPDLIERSVAATSACLIYNSISDSSQACAQHLALRLVLHRANAIPWNYARFLNHCTDRLLLQRVGGRYRFIHKLVQEHFAAMPLSR